MKTINIKKYIAEEFKKQLNENSYSYEKKVTAKELLKYILSETGEEFKADWTGATDRFGPITKANITKINRGKGFETAIRVFSNKGHFYYIAPFVVVSEPNKENMLIFKCDDAFYVNDND